MARSACHQAPAGLGLPVGIAVAAPWGLVGAPMIGAALSAGLSRCAGVGGASLWARPGKAQAGPWGRLLLFVTALQVRFASLGEPAGRISPPTPAFRGGFVGGEE